MVGYAALGVVLGLLLGASFALRRDGWRTACKRTAWATGGTFLLQLLVLACAQNHLVFLAVRPCLKGRGRRRATSRQHVQRSALLGHPHAPRSAPPQPPAPHPALTALQALLCFVAALPVFFLAGWAGTKARRAWRARAAAAAAAAQALCRELASAKVTASSDADAGGGKERLVTVDLEASAPVPASLAASS